MSAVFMNAGEGVTIGKNVSVKFCHDDYTYNRYVLQHEMCHTEQIAMYGAIRFYTRTIYEYFRSFFESGNWKDVYTTMGTLEFLADKMTFEKVGYYYNGSSIRYVFP